MKQALKMAALALTLVAAGCGSQPAAAVPASPTARSDQPASAGVTASAVILAQQESQLSFVLEGSLKELDVHEGQEVRAGQQLLVLEVPALEFAVVQAEAALRAAEFEYQYWIPPRFDRPPERRQLAEQQLFQVQRALDTARAELSQATLAAPFDGTIMKIGIAVGEWAQPGQIVVVVADLTHLQSVTTDLSERDLRGVQMGQPVEIFVEALANTFPGRVVRISPIAAQVGGDVLYEVTLEFDHPPGGLLPGMSAEVRFAQQ